MSKVFQLVLYGVALLLIAAMLLYSYMVTLPGKLPELDGMVEINAGQIKMIDVGAQLAVAKKKGQKISFTEEQLNHYLASKLNVEQSGKLAKYAKVKGVWVELEKDYMNVYLERFVSVERGQDEDGHELEPYEQSHIIKQCLFIRTIKDDAGAVILQYANKGGSIGAAPAPALLSEVSWAAFAPLGELLEDDIKLFKIMVKVNVDEGVIHFHPTLD